MWVEVPYSTRPDMSPLNCAYTRPTALVRSSHARHQTRALWHGCIEMGSHSESHIANCRWVDDCIGQYRRSGQTFVNIHPWKESLRNSSQPKIIYRYAAVGRFIAKTCLHLPALLKYWRTQEYRRTNNFRTGREFSQAEHDTLTERYSSDDGMRLPSLVLHCYIVHTI